MPVAAKEPPSQLHFTQLTFLPLPPEGQSSFTAARPLPQQRGVVCTTDQAIPIQNVRKLWGPCVRSVTDRQLRVMCHSTYGDGGKGSRMAAAVGGCMARWLDGPSMPSRGRLLVSCLVSCTAGASFCRPGGETVDAVVVESGAFFPGTPRKLTRLGGARRCLRSGCLRQHQSWLSLTRQRWTSAHAH